MPPAGFPLPTGSMRESATGATLGQAGADDEPDDALVARAAAVVADALR